MSVWWCSTTARATCAPPSGRWPRAGADVLVTDDLSAAAATPTAWWCRAWAPSPPAWPGIEALGAGPVIAERVAAGPAGAGHLRGHADPLRARRRARRGDQGPRPAARRRDAAAPPTRLPHMGWNTVRAAAPVGALRRPAARTPVLLRPLVRGAAGPAADRRRGGGDHRRTTVETSSPRWSGARSGAPSSTRRSPADTGAGCCATGSPRCRLVPTGRHPLAGCGPSEQGTGPPAGRAGGRSARDAGRAARRVAERRAAPPRAGAPADAHLRPARRAGCWPGAARGERAVIVVLTAGGAGPDLVRSCDDLALRIALHRCCCCSYCRRSW